MIDDLPPFFWALSSRVLYRIYVASDELLFLPLGGGERYIGDGRAFGVDDTIRALGGADYLYDSERTEEAYAQDSSIKTECTLLDKRSADDLRIWIKNRKRGFRARLKDIDRCRLDYVMKWKKWLLFFGRPSPALFLTHAKEGRWTFVFGAKADAVIALCELERLLGDDLENALQMKHFRKAVKKYDRRHD